MTVRPRRFQTRVVLTALAAVLPVSAAALIMALAAHVSQKAVWTTAFFVGVSVFIATYVLHEVLVHPIRTLTNVLTAVREEDFSLRARGARPDDALGELMIEVNALAATMQSRKLEAVEAGALLRAVLAEIDAAIFAFDSNDRLQFANRAAEKLLAIPVERMSGHAATDIGLAELVSAGAPATVDRSFPGGSGRWSVRRSTFREKGQPHQLLVIADISRQLREEETRAWQRIVRVLGHELNNSLAPIKSIGSSIESLAMRDPLPEDWRDDIARGARVIASRAETLTRFTHAYAQLARLPQPQKRDVDVANLVQRVVALETRMGVDVTPGPSVTIEADDAQLEQMIINLVRNAVEASLETGGSTRVRWHLAECRVIISIEDEGRGLAASGNLFVPFFTTKSGGTGIGLVLSRQIAEAHGGTVTLENRAGGGAAATVILPVTSS